MQKEFIELNARVNGDPEQVNPCSIRTSSITWFAPSVTYSGGTVIEVQDGTYQVTESYEEVRKLITGE